MMKMLLLLFCAALFISGTPESFLLSVTGNKPAVLKTSNGCWDVNQFIINRGDTSLSVPASIWYYSDGAGGILETLPANYLLDFSFPDIYSQEWLNGGSDERYFAAVTENYVYLFGAHPDPYEIPKVTRLDSLVTPSGYTGLFVYDLTELLVVSRQDSFNYSYTFHNLPLLYLDTQITLNVMPEKIIAGDNGYPLYQKYYYIIGNDGNGTVFFSINLNNHEITPLIMLPGAASNTKEIVNGSNFFFFLCSPGDTAVNLVKLNKADSALTVTSLLSNSGIHASTIYDFIFQPTNDLLGNELHKQLLVVDAYSGVIKDTIRLNKRVISLHFNPELYYDDQYIAFGSESPNSNNWAYFYSPSSFTLDSFRTSTAPTWFAEDIRCYVGIEEIEKNLAIKVYPNPADEQVNIQITGLATEKTYYFDISNESGRIIWNQEIFSKQEYTIPLQQFPSGLLLLRVNAGTKIVTKKILKI